MPRIKKKPSPAELAEKWAKFFEWISEFYPNEPLKDVTVKELVEKVHWDKQEVKFRIDINKFFYFLYDYSSDSDEDKKEPTSEDEKIDRVAKESAEWVDKKKKSVKPPTKSPVPPAQATTVVDLCNSPPAQPPQGATIDLRSPDQSSTAPPSQGAIIDLRSPDQSSSDRRNTSNSLGSVGDMARRAGTRIGSALVALKCTNNTPSPPNNKRHRSNRASTFTAKVLSGAKNVFTKKPKADDEEGSDDGDKSECLLLCLCCFIFGKD